MPVPYYGDFPEDATVRIPFNTFSSDDPSASVTITNLADADIMVHKDGGTTQIATDGATVSIDFDTVTGNHYIVVDTSAHADYATGSEYAVRIEGTTVDAATINAWVGSFSIERAGGALALIKAGNLSANVVQISGDSTAADNLELQYDTTGLTGDTFPSTQSQLSGLANVGSAVHRPAASYTLTTGTQSANTYTSTEALDVTRHEHTDDAGEMELYYEFNIGSGTASSVQITGYVTGPNDDLDIYGYDWVAAGWVQIGNIQGSSSTSNQVNSFDMFVDMVGSGANFGVVRVRAYKASGLSSATLAIDQIFVAFNQGISGYEGGAIWYDSNASNTNTVVRIDGTAENPVSTMGAVNTLLAATNLNAIHVAPGSTVTLAAAQNNQVFRGSNWALALGGRDIGGSHFYGVHSVTGTGTGASTSDFHDCIIGTATLNPCHFHNCGFEGTLTFGAAGDYIVEHGYSAIAGATTPVFDTGAAIANVNLAMPNYFNGAEIQNLNNAGTDLFSISGIGQIIYAASCSGTVNQRGSWKVTNTGGVTITEDDNTANLILALADTNELQTDWANDGRLDLLLDAIKAITDNLPNSGALTTIGADTARLTAARAAILTDWINGGRLDLLLDAIKVITDQMVFTKANELDSNVLSINDVTITGDGSGTPFDV